MKKVFSRFVTLLGLGSLFATQGQSAIVYRDLETTLTIGNGGWDIDADGTDELTMSTNRFAEWEGGNVSFVEDTRTGIGVAGLLTLRNLAINISVADALGAGLQWDNLLRYGRAVANSVASINLLSFAPSFSLNERARIGFRFDGDRATSGRQNFYGWASVTATNLGQTWTIHEWAYEDVIGEAIAVGQIVPEPTSASLGLLALGAAGLRRWRKE